MTHDDNNNRQNWAGMALLQQFNMEERGGGGRSYHPCRSSWRKAWPAPFFFLSIPSPMLAHIYALGVSAVSRWILMCFKEASPVLSSSSSFPPSIHPASPPLLSLSSLPPPCCWSSWSWWAQTRSAFRLVKTPMAPNQRDYGNQTTSPGFKLP